MKNINFFGDSKKLFLTHWKTVFWVTEQFCIKWTFWKNAFFCPKNAFFWQKWPVDPRRSAAERQCQGTFFGGGILLLKSWRILLGKIGHMVKPPFDSSQFSLKSAIFGGFEKKVSKSDWNQRHIVYVTQIHYFTWLDHLWTKKCHNFG